MSFSMFVWPTTNINHISFKSHGHLHQKASVCSTMKSQMKYIHRMVMARSTGLLNQICHCYKKKSNTPTVNYLKLVNYLLLDNCPDSFFTIVIGEWSKLYTLDLL